MIARIQTMAPTRQYTQLETKKIAASIRSHSLLLKTQPRSATTLVRSSWWRGRVVHRQASSRCLLSNRSQSIRSFSAVMTKLIPAGRKFHRRRQSQVWWSAMAWSPQTPLWGRRNRQQVLLHKQQIFRRPPSNRMIQLAIALPSPCWARCRAH